MSPDICIKSASSPYTVGASSYIIYSELFLREPRTLSQAEVGKLLALDCKRLTDALKP